MRIGLKKENEFAVIKWYEIKRVKIYNQTKILHLIKTGSLEITKLTDYIHTGAFQDAAI